MKNILLSLWAAFILTSCSVKPKTELQAISNIKGTAVYGDSVKNDNVIDLAAMRTAMQDESKLDLKIKGVVNEVCEKKGCWMLMKLDNGEDLRITFKDYKIFVPKDLEGKEVILDGFAYTDTASVEDQQHYAKDANKSASEIAKITLPKKELAYEAKGVVVLN
ncbi:DUF4920 domain-containing protein [Daejeonella oryzae]|uniref:DUF4920 domain-containing protein n=1 Tax=Daejeonella oryzae TaxID=1122943 RepID=UPI0003F873ED|nr:DUF4920 domain-containing protein [Daejeonella oryzae]